VLLCEEVGRRWFDDDGRALLAGGTTEVTGAREGGVVGRERQPATTIRALSE